MPALWRRAVSFNVLIYKIKSEYFSGRLGFKLVLAKGDALITLKCSTYRTKHLATCQVHTFSCFNQYAVIYLDK